MVGRSFEEFVLESLFRTPGQAQVSSLKTLATLASCPLWEPVEAMEVMQLRT